MIEWDKAIKEINRLLIKIVPKEANALDVIIAKYFKDLIAKEFKLVARGKVRISYKDDMEISVGEILLKTALREYQYNGKNIEVYISEEK